MSFPDRRNAQITTARCRKLAEKMCHSFSFVLRQIMTRNQTNETNFLTSCTRVRKATDLRSLWLPQQGKIPNLEGPFHLPPPQLLLWSRCHPGPGIPQGTACTQQTKAQNSLEESLRCTLRTPNVTVARPVMFAQGRF